MRRFLMMLFLLVLFILALALEIAGETRFDRFNRFLSLCQQNRYFNGSVLVAENGKVIFKKGIGKADFGWGITNKTDTGNERVGIIIQAVNAAALGILRCLKIHFLIVIRIIAAVAKIDNIE